MISPFASRLGTNYCPADDEISQIKAFLFDPSLRLKRIDEESAVLQRERDFLATSIDAHKALITPVRRLPLDIIQEIFLACLPAHRNCVMSATEAPVLLGRICSLWRAISLNMPRLWTRINVVQPYRQHWTPSDMLANAKGAQRVEVLKTWLGRSGELPLSISLVAINPQSIQALLPFAARWQHIQFLSKMPSSLLEPLSRMTEADVPMLETITFHHGLPPRQEDWGGFTMFGGPRLSGFTAATRDFATGDLPLRWHQLTTLRMRGFPNGDGMTSHNILQLLSRCPQLRACKVAFGNSGDTSHPPVELKFLHSLHLVSGAVDDAVSFFLDRLLLPELRNFTLRTPNAHYTQTNGQHDPPPLFRYIALWNKLESLEIDTGLFPESSWLQAIRSLPTTMRQLVIHNTRIRLPIETTLTILTPLPGIPAQCPVLEGLVISRSRSLPEAALLRFIAARMRGASPPTLRRVEVAFNREMEADILPDLQLFIDSGLRVSVTYHPPAEIHGSSPWTGLDESTEDEPTED
ncbi:hypothetical protein B0H16DRAFT_1524297 [Mycena metata]|uniref:F-box domain-containing protein n=1 Tax=Mycena metata TaxID=1033252 RepID=A0AAD7NL52_9AGAR|nr:hypothetical protein B0H16DRAFT_1524297 [Mycena metata]